MHLIGSSCHHWLLKLRVLAGACGAIQKYLEHDLCIRVHPLKYAGPISRPRRAHHLRAAKRPQKLGLWVDADLSMLKTSDGMSEEIVPRNASLGG